MCIYVESGLRYTIETHSRLRAPKPEFRGFDELRAMIGAPLPTGITSTELTAASGGAANFWEGTRHASGIRLRRLS